MATSVVRQCTHAHGIVLQGYASDTFALALAAFHLFTGEAPYEEIMEEVCT